MKKKRRVKILKKTKFRSKNNDDFLKSLKEESSLCENKLKNLNKFIKKKNKKIVEDKYKIQWVKEFKRLSKLQFKLEDDIHPLSESVAVEDLNDSFDDYPEIDVDSSQSLGREILEKEVLIERLETELKECNKRVYSSLRNDNFSYFFSNPEELIRIMNIRIPVVELETPSIREMFLEKLVAEYEEEVYRRQTQYKERVKELKSTMNDILTKPERFLFRKVYEEYKYNNNFTHKQKHRDFLTRVKDEVGAKNITLRSIQKYYSRFIELNKLKRIEFQQARPSYNTRMSDKTTQMFESLIISSQLNQLLKIEETLKRDFEEKKRATKTRLSQLRNEKLNRQKLIAQETAAIEKREFEKEAERVKLMALERERVQRLILDFRTKRAEESAAIRKEEERRALEKKVEREIISKKNEERTLLRRKEYQKKLEVRRLRKEREMQQARRKERELERIREEVRPKNVRRDRKRMMQETESIKNNVGDVVYCTDEKNLLFKEVYSYTNEQIFADTRARLMNALQNAGLHNTDAAREVFIKFQPDNYRRDMKNSSKIFV